MKKNICQLTITTVMFIIAICFFATSVSWAEPKKEKIDRPLYVANEIIVRFADKTDNAKISVLKTNKGMNLRRKLFLAKSEVFQVDKDRNISDVIKELSKDPNVVYAQPNYIYYIDAVAVDPEFSKLWGLHNMGQNINGSIGVADKDIDAPEAWDISMGSSEVVVAVIDEGIDINHPDIAANIWINTGETGSNGIDDDSNGYVDDINGYDFFNHDKTVFDVTDTDQHGTHVAGTIAAVVNNGVGIAGVAPKVKIMPLKVFGPAGATTADIVLALEYAQANGADVINASFGKTGIDTTMQDAITACGLPLIAAAGNVIGNNDTSPISPAALNSPNIISVAAVDNQGNLADFSNYGAATVDVGAPGVDIYSLRPVYPAIGAAVQIYDTNFGYKAVHFGFGLEDVSLDANRAVIMKRALDFLDTGTDTPIILVDDDNSGNGDPDYFPQINEALSGYNVVQIVYAGNDTDGNFGTPATVAATGKTIIWFTGDAYGDMSNNTLTVNDTIKLMQFLDAGGRLLLIGSDIAEGNVNNSLFTTYMEESVITDLAPSTTVFDTVYGYTYSLGHTLTQNPYWDTLVPAGISTEMFKYSACVPAESYQYMDGTSMSTPHVTGLAALMLSVNPTLTPAQMNDIMKQTVDLLTLLAGKTVSGGMVNAYKAVMAAKIPDTPTGLVATAGDAEVDFTWDAVDDTDLAGYNLYQNNDKINGSTIVGIGFNKTGLSNEITYNYKVTAIDDYGFESTASAEVSATPHLGQVTPTISVTGKDVAKNGDTLVFGGGATVGATVYSAKLEQLDEGYLPISSADIDVLGSLSIDLGTLSGLVVVPVFDEAAKYVRLNVYIDSFGDIYSANSTPLAIDNTLPNISTRLPANNTSNVSVANNLEVTFSEPVNSTSINSTNLVLSSITYGVESIVVTYNSAQYKATINPVSTLKYSTQYTVTVNSGVCDLAGNSLLGAPLTWDFTTQAAPVTPSGGGGGGGGTSAVSEPVVTGLVENPTDTAINLESDALSTVTSLLDGQTTTIVTIDEAKALASLEQNAAALNLVLFVDNTTAAVNTELSSGLISVLTARNGSVEVQTAIGSYILPTAEIKMLDLGQQLGVSAQNIKIVVSISSVKADQANTLKTITTKNGLIQLVNPIKFRVEAVSGEKKIEISRFSCYVSREIVLPITVDSNRAVGIVYNDDGTVSSVPTQFINENGKTVAVIKRKSNSVYTVIENTKSFSDAKGHWAKDDINTLAAKLIISGMNNNEFIPEGKVTRAQFAALIVKSLGLLPNPVKVSFSDIGEKDWYAGAVGAAVEAGLVKGYQDGTFRPNNMVTREEASVILVKALKLAGVDTNITSEESEKYLTQLNDWAEISSWAKNAVAVAVKNGVIKGNSKGSFIPANNSTRAESAVIIKRMLEKAQFI
jgi:subtilisin family serine protease